MATIVYLDVDDEITSAATRLRGAAESRVALVLPFGSRLATSRINFRLLAREGATHGRRLAIVAPDAATRALAASAGLAVFASVTEYEEAVEDGTDDDAAEAAGAKSGTPERPSAGGRRGGRASGPGAAATTAATGPGALAGAGAGGAAAAAGTAAGAAAAAAATGSGDDATVVLPAADGSRSTRRGAKRPGSAGDGTPGGAGAGAGLAGAAVAGGGLAGAGPAGGAGGGPAGGATRSRPGRDVPVVAAPRSIGVRPIAILGVGLLALAVLVAGVAAYVFLPNATIIVTPRLETIALSLAVTADPAATEVDPASAIIPATVVQIPLSATGEFRATGKRVEEARASGRVRFESINTVGPVEVPDGTRVSTLGGIVFVTRGTVTVPAATVAGSVIERGTVAVDVRAQKAGPEGNVEAREITQVPDFLRTQQVSAINPAATSGGKRDEFPQIVQADVDAALEQLRADIRAQFDAQIAAPTGAPEGATVFAETATLAEPTPTIDPATLVEQEVATFTLELTATGSVVTVDEGPLQGIAERLVVDAVKAGYEIVEGSTEISVGSGTVADGAITFALGASARQVAILDPAAIEAMVLGLPVADVARELDAFGSVETLVWPDFVATIPTFDSRVEVVIGEVATDATPGDPSGDPSAEPVPSTSMSQPTTFGRARPATRTRDRIDAA